MRIDELAADAHAYYTASRSSFTTRTYGTGVGKFLEFLSTQGINPSDDTSRLTPLHFKRVGLWMSKQYKDSTLVTYMAGVISLLSYAQMFEEVNFSTDDIAQIYKVRQNLLRKRNAPLPRTPGDNDVRAMIDAVRSMSFPSPAKERNIAIIEFLASSGCRVGEVVKMNVKDVNLEERAAVVTGKGNKSRWAYFSTKAKESISAYWGERGRNMPSYPVFSRHDKRASTNVLPLSTMSVQNLVRDVAEHAGIEGFTPHVFRHGFAVEMLDRTSNLALVQDLMGHADPAATRVYAKVKPERLREAHREVYG